MIGCGLSGLGPEFEAAGSLSKTISSAVLELCQGCGALVTELFFRQDSR